MLNLINKFRWKIRVLVIDILIFFHSTKERRA